MRGCASAQPVRCSARRRAGSLLRLRRGARLGRRSFRTTPRAGSSRPLPVSLLCGHLTTGGHRSRRRMPRRTTFPTSSSGSGSPPWGGSPGCRATRSPTASAGSACAPCAWRAARTSPCGRGRVREAIAVELELPEAVSGQQLERALELLIARLLAHRRAARQDVAGAAPLGPPRGRRRLAAAGRAAAARARIAPASATRSSPSSPCCRPRRDAAAGGDGARARDRRAAHPVRARRRSAAGASRRRSARRARPPAPTRSCGCSRWIQTRGCRSAATC